MTALGDSVRLHALVCGSSFMLGVKTRSAGQRCSTATARESNTYPWVFNNIPRASMRHSDVDHDVRIQLNDFSYRSAQDKNSPRLQFSCLELIMNTSVEE